MAWALQAYTTQIWITTRKNGILRTIVIVVTTTITKVITIVLRWNADRWAKQIQQGGQQKQRLMQGIEAPSRIIWYRPVIGTLRDFIFIEKHKMSTHDLNYYLFRSGCGANTCSKTTFPYLSFCKWNAQNGSCGNSVLATTKITTAKVISTSSKV